MTNKQVAVSTLWQIASQALMAAMSAISVKFVAIGLSKELAGAYNSAYGFLQLFAILADFGLYAVSVREVSRATDRERVLGALLVLRCCITFLSLGMAITIAWIVPSWRGTVLPMGITIATFVPFFTLLAGVLRTTFQITYSMHYVFIAEVLQRILTMSLMGLMILYGVRGSTDPQVYALFLGVGSLGAFLLFILSLIFSLQKLPLRPCFDREMLRSLLLRSAPYGVAFLCIALYRQFDLTLIALLRDDFKLQNAEYGFALRLTEMTYLLPTFLLNSTLPILGERSHRGEDTRSFLGTTLLSILMLGGITSLFSFFWARPLMQLLTTNAYLSTALKPGADTALAHLAVPMFLNGLVLYSFYILLNEHRWKPLVGCMIVAVILSLGFNLIFIPSEGYIGAIRTLTIVHLFLSISLLPFAQRTLPALLDVARFSWFVVSMAALGILLFVLAPHLTSMMRTMIACFALLPVIGLIAYPVVRQKTVDSR